jgi:predicted transcriptional regulator
LRDYRSRTEIAARILEAAMGGTTKTKIIYSVYLSYQQLGHYLTLLVDNGSWRFDGKGFTSEGKEERERRGAGISTNCVFVPL